MKKITLFTFLLLSSLTFAQKQKLQLSNALIVGLMDKEDERFMLEIALTEFFASEGVKAVPSLNILKQGSDPSLLATDSMRAVVKEKGLDTYMLASVRGYDSRFKKSEKNDAMPVALDYGTLFSLFREEATSVTFEFFIYRNDVLVKTALVRCGNVSSKETVLKRLKKKLARKYKKW
jgi:hypothetical protein